MAFILDEYTDGTRDLFDRGLDERGRSDYSVNCSDSLWGTHLFRFGDLAAQGSVCRVEGYGNKKNGFIIWFGSQG